MENQAIIERVSAAKLGETVELSDVSNFKSFELCSSGDSFYWRVEDKSGFPYYPMQSNRRILSFKTMDGAKRNYLRKFKV